MVTNFGFLKEIDKNLYTLIDDAERLYRDEYFDQCMTQTRRFGENVCKNVLGGHRTTETTFDAMLATLKDKGTGEVQEKEFIDDLYFLKKHGNSSTHSLRVKTDGMEALECLQRAFEVAVSYAVYHCGAKSSILKLRYDTELMLTGKKASKSLAQKFEESKKLYEEELEKTTQTVKTANKKTSAPKKKKKKVSQCHTMSSKKKKKGPSIFWITVGISAIFSILLTFCLFLVSLK